jgi:hypothetical protein
MSVPLRTRDIEAEPPPPGATDPQPTVQVESKWSLGRERRLASWILLAVGAGYLVAQLALMPLHRPIGWDEAIYMTQVTPGMEALFVDAWRARGITLLIAPVTLLGGSLADVRLFLMVASAAAVTVAFRLWIPLIGIGAPIAAFLFSFAWLGLVNGSTVMPNFWAAILGVATAGLVARRLEGGTVLQAVLAAAVLGMMALVRPTEAAILAGVVALYILLIRPTSWRLLLGLALGLALGWLPWIVEMSIRFDGLTRALEEVRAAGHFGDVSVTQNVLVHLGRTYGRAKLPAFGLPEAGILWWGLLVLLAAIALRRQGDSPARSVALLGWLATIAFAVEYFVLVPFTAGRFLLPVYAFAAIVAAIGLVSLLRNGIAARLVGAVVLVLMVPWAVWQGDVGSSVVAGQARGGTRFATAGLLLRDLADGRPCSFVSPGAFPQLHFVSGCVGEQLGPPPLPTPAQWDAAAAGEEVFIILPRTVHSDHPLAVLSPIRFRAPRRMWFIYQLSQLYG